MKKEEIKSYLEGRLNSLIDTAVGFEGYLGKAYSTVQSQQLAVKSRKKENPEATAEDFKSDILDISKKFYKMSMVEQNLKNIACAISELKLFASVSGAELEMTEKRKEIYDMMESSDRDIFAYENGEIVPVDLDWYSKLETELENKLNDKKTLENNFNLI